MSTVTELHPEPFVTVIDAVMGAGKTHWMRHELARRSGLFAEMHERFVYVTPYLTEAEEAVKKITEAGAPDVCLVKDRDLEEGRGMQKRDHLYKLLTAGKSAVGSHRLFEVLDPRVMRRIEVANYVLVIDEATQWVQPYKDLKASELSLLFRTGHAYVDQDLVIRWNDQVPDVDGKLNERGTIYSDFRELCLQGKLVASDPKMNKYGVPGEMLVWTMPVGMLQQFSHVFVLTHLFEGSEMSAYLRMNGMRYQMKTLDAERNVVDFDPRHNAERIKALAPKVTIESNPKLNQIGEPKRSVGGKRVQDPLSKAWFKRDLEEAQERARAAAVDDDADVDERIIGEGAKVLRANLTHFYRYCTRTGPSANMWTTLKEFRSALAPVNGARYRDTTKNQCFVSCNARATNNYNHKTALAYCASINHDPSIKRYFARRGVAISNDWLALSTIAQWIFRSAVRREPELGGPLPIRVYIPSRRMRELFQGYLNGLLPQPAKLEDIDLAEAA